MFEPKQIKSKYAKLRETPEVQEKLKTVYKIETRYAIILAINSFGSLNIKKLATFLNKNEATIYHHIKEMLKEPTLLEIDEQETKNRKGIYYKLSQLAAKHFGYQPSANDFEEKMNPGLDKILEQSDEKIAEVYINMMKLHPELGNMVEKEEKKLVFNRIQENLILNNFRKTEEALMNDLEPVSPNYPIGAISNTNYDMKITKPRHLFEFLKLLADFETKFLKLKEQIKKEIENGNVPEEEQIDLHFHLVGGEITEFQFKNKK